MVLPSLLFRALASPFRLRLKAALEALRPPALLVLLPADVVSTLPPTLLPIVSATALALMLVLLLERLQASLSQVKMPSPSFSLLVLPSPLRSHPDSLSAPEFPLPSLDMLMAKALRLPLLMASLPPWLAWLISSKAWVLVPVPVPHRGL